MGRGSFCGSVGAENLERFWNAERGLPVSGTLQVRQTGGRLAGDFVYTGAIPLVHERVIDLMSRVGLTGWRTYPIELIEKTGTVHSEYHGLAVTGRCSWVSFDRREEAIVLIPNRSGGHSPHFRGLKFPLESWDGSDFFMGNDLKVGGSWIVATERVTELFSKHKVKGCELTPLEEVEMLALKSDIIRKPKADAG